MFRLAVAIMQIYIPSFVVDGIVAVKKKIVDGLVLWNKLGINYILCTLILFMVSLCLPIPLSKWIVRKVKLLRILFLQSGLMNLLSTDGLACAKNLRA